jgi:hypothetical protein
MYWYFLTFIIFHFILYLYIFRNFKIFRHEQVIFIYHLVFFLISLTVMIFAYHNRALTILTFFGLLSLLLIYNMTFLDIWSLAQGSYSLQILSIVSLHPGISTTDIISKTKYIGVEKKDSRLQHLINMRLAKINQLNEIKLTPFGILINQFFNAIKLFTSVGLK